MNYKYLKLTVACITFVIHAFASNQTQEQCNFFENPEFGLYELQGRRKSMEDRHAIRAQEGFFGLYDGHAGSEIAEFARRNLHTYFFDFLKNNETVEEAFKKAFLKADTIFAHKKTVAGSTAICGYFKDNKLFVANAGDSRAVISRNGKAVALSNDHKPNIANEYERILNSGGYVTLKGVPRVNGILAISRALGDFYLKKPDQKQDIVIAEPEITQLKLNGNDEFVILACDGLWDVVENQEAIDFVRSKILENKQYNLTEIAAELVAYAYTKGSTDNISVIIIKSNLFGKKKVESLKSRLSSFIKVGAFISFIYFAWKYYQYYKRIANIK